MRTRGSYAITENGLCAPHKNMGNDFCPDDVIMLTAHCTAFEFECKHARTTHTQRTHITIKCQSIWSGVVRQPIVIMIATLGCSLVRSTHLFIGDNRETSCAHCPMHFYFHFTFTFRMHYYQPIDVCHGSCALCPIRMRKTGEHIVSNIV